jgi:dihydroorotate dehydrogenase
VLRLGSEYARFIQPREPGLSSPRRSRSSRAAQFGARFANTIGTAELDRPAERRAEVYLRTSCPSWSPLAARHSSARRDGARGIRRDGRRLAARRARRRCQLGCPNVDAGDRDAAEALRSSASRAPSERLPDRCVATKLTPNVTDITNRVRGAEQGGADAVVAINTLAEMTSTSRLGAPRSRERAGCRAQRSSGGAAQGVGDQRRGAHSGDRSRWHRAG